MGSNPPIRAVPTQVAQPNIHIARFISGLRPHLAEHAYRGATYFVRSRAGGDVLCEEDWNSNYVPPLLDPVSLAKLLHSRRSSGSGSGTTSSSSSDRSRGSPDKPRPARDNTHNVDPERAKQALRALAERACPYPKRRSVEQPLQQQQQHETTTTTTGPQRHQPLSFFEEQAVSQAYGYAPQGGGRISAASVAQQLQLAYAQAQAHASVGRHSSDQQSRVDRANAALHHLLELGGGGSVGGNSAPAAPRLTLPYGIFARGVASQPLKVSQQQPQQQQTQHAAPARFNENQFLGLALDPSLSGVEKTLSPQMERHDSTGASFPYSLNPTSPTADVLSSQFGSPNQLSPVVADRSFFGAGAGAAVLPNNNSQSWPVNPLSRQYPALDSLASMLSAPAVPTSSQWPLSDETSNLPAYLRRQPLFMGRPVEIPPQAAVSRDFPLSPNPLMDIAQEERALSADPPKRSLPSPPLDTSDWQRPLSAPPSKPHGTPAPSLQAPPAITDLQTPFAFDIDPAWLTPSEPLKADKPDPQAEPEAEPETDPIQWPWSGSTGLDVNLFPELSPIPPHTYGFRTEPTINMSSPFLSPLAQSPISEQVTFPQLLQN